jgi:two-component system CheB/CheR fusion protein
VAGEPSVDLLRVVHPNLRAELRAALFRARQSGETARAPAVPFDLAGVARAVDIQVTPITEGSDFWLVTFELRSADAAVEMPSPDPDEPALRHLERELEQTKVYLRDIVEQHEASTEELKASNEELQAMNEELRSATEELETSREELQSINEELTTVNQELKIKVDELGHANSDLHNLIGATAIAMVFLDRELRIMRYTPPAVELFNLIPSDVGRPLADLQHRLGYPELLSDGARVLQQLVPIEREMTDDVGRYFLARVLPYRTTDDRIAGVVLTFVDISERRSAEEAVRSAQQGLEERVIERTAQLDAANAQLQREFLGQQRAERARQELQVRLLNAQEAERSRISRELHDEVGQQISALLLSLKALESQPHDQAAATLRELRNMTEQVGRAIHQLAFQLRPLALDEVGLARALAGYVEGWLTRTGIAVDYVSAGIESARLPSQIETTIYRIVQEAMNNVYKHASATGVSVSVERRGGHVIAIIEDDGVGFEPDAAPPSGAQPRIGIAGMRERAELVGGELTVESIPTRGTTVRVKIPLPKS